MSKIGEAVGETAKGVVGGAMEGALEGGESIGERIVKVGDEYSAMREAQGQANRAEGEAAEQEEVLRRKRANPGQSVGSIRNEVESGQ